MSEPTGARRYGVGGGDAYYDAVRYGGYEGTREQFGKDQAEFAQNAAVVAEAKETVERDTEEVRNTKNTFENTTVPEAIRALEQESEDQILAITQKGEEVSQQVETVGTEQKDAVANEGRARVRAVEQAGTDQVQAVEDAGTAQVGNVNQAGEDQIDAVEQAGADQVQAVTDEGTTQVRAVQDEGGIQVQMVQNKGDEVLESIPSDYTALDQKVDNLKENNQGLISLSFTLTQNKMIDGTDGVERASNASRYASDYINVENLTKINLYSAFRGDYGAAFYDEHNAFISGVIAADGYNEQPYLYSLDVPSGAKYFRFTVYVVNMPYTDAYLGIPSTHDDFKNYIVALNENNKSEYSLPFTLTRNKMINAIDGVEYVASASYYASNQVNVEGLSKIILYSAFIGDYGCAFYNADGVYISGAIAEANHNQQPYTYELDVPSTAKYFRFTVYSVNMPASRATLKIPTSQIDIINSIRTLNNTKVSNDTPITDMPIYIKRNLSNKRIGELSKGYICLVADDGKAELATYTIPMLTAKNVPCTFALIPNSEVINDATNLQTVLTAINNGCSVAMHGTTQWVHYVENTLNKYFNDAEATFTAAGITNIEGAVCPGDNAAHDTNELIQCVAGGRYGVLCSGGLTGEITYGDYALAGPRTNIFAINRYSAIRFTESTYKAAIDYAYDNHLILLPFWHDNQVGNSLESQAIIEGMIDYAKTKGLEFITLGQIATIT